MRNIFEKASKNDSLSYYFPTILSDTIVKNPRYKDFEQRWYSSTLYSFKEPILYTKSGSQTIYRLLWLRSFHQPVCFSVKEFDDGYFLNAKILNKQPAFYPVIINNDTIQKTDRLAFITSEKIKVLTSKQWKEIENYLSKLNFWEGSIDDPNDEETTDGANWIFEGRKDKKYHFIKRRNDRGELIPFGKYLIKLSGLNVGEDEIY